MDKKLTIRILIIIGILFGFWIGYLLGANKPITPITSDAQASQDQNEENQGAAEKNSELFNSMLKRSYSRAIQDAKDVEKAEISTELWPISAENDNLVKTAKEEEEKILVATWTSWDGYDNKIDSSMTLSREIWVTAVPQVQQFCQELNMSPNDLTLRLEQYLGLPANNGKTKFVEMWVKPADMFRPCADPEIDDTQCNLGFTEPVDPEHKKWMENLISSSYNENGFPWTRLGYTYDWGSVNSDIGASEFIVKQGADVTIKSVQTTAEYCSE